MEMSVISFLKTEPIWLQIMKI